MSDETNDTGAAESADPVKNVKEEFNRKLGNVEAQMAETNRKLSQQLDALLAASKPAPAAAPSQAGKKISVFEDEDAFAQTIVNSATAAIDARLAAATAAQQKQAQTIGALMQEFPEIGDGSHTLTKRAVEIYNSMGDDEKNSPVAYRAAVQSAALEQGVKPKSKRTSDDTDTFSLGGGNSSSEARASTRSSKSQGGIDNRTKLFAESVGLNLDDPKNKAAAERIKTRHGRKSYENWG